VPDIGLLLLTTRDGRPVYVKDVADVTVGTAEPEHRAWTMTRLANGELQRLPAVTIAVAKRKGSNAVVVAEDVMRRLDAVKGRVIPADLEVSVTRNYGATASEKANELLFHLGLATVSIVVLITLAIGWRKGLVVLIVIPTTILLTLFASWLMGYTINRVSLFALIFSIGILVDDAIVVVENIARHWAMNDGRSRTDAAIAAVAEVGNPTVVATLTIVAALLPMMFVSGLMGPYMSPIPANASIAMLFSLFIAVTVTPWLLLRFARKRVPALAAAHGVHTIGAMGRFYAAIARPLLKGRIRSKVFLLAVGAATLAACSLFYTEAVRVKLLPFDNKSEIQVVLDLPHGSTLEDTDRMLMMAAERLKTLPELVSIQADSGTASPFNFNGLVRHYYLRANPEQGDLSINLLPKGERSRASHTIALDIRRRLADLPLPEGSALKVVEVPPGPPVLATLLAEVYGPDAGTRRATAAKIRRAFESVDFIVDVDDSYGKPSDRLRFSIDQEALEFHGVEEQAVYDAISALLGGVKVGFSQRGEGLKPIDISLKLPKSAMTLDERLLSTPLPAGGTVRQGANVELGDVVKVTRERASYPIFRHNGRFLEMVSGDVAGRFEAPIYGMLAVQGALAKMDWGPGGPPQIKYHGQPVDESRPTLLWDGEWEVTYVTFRDWRGLHGGDPRHLSARRRAVWLVSAAARYPGAGAAHPDRHRAWSLAARRGVHGDLDDRLHCAGRHHRAQFDLAGGLHPPSPRGRWRARGARRGRRDAVQADRADRSRGDDRRGVYPD
jgi:multidrug efflux pump subunit AcrB